MSLDWRTDKPPEERKDYLVTTESGDLDIARYTNASEWWHGETTNWHWQHPPYTRVYAWRDLPEPCEIPELGTWVFKDEYNLDSVVSIECSLCGQGMWHSREGEDVPNYCCNCGAKMGFVEKTSMEAEDGRTG